MSTLKVDGIRSNGDTSGNDAITLADNGRVGIGTSSPTTLLNLQVQQQTAKLITLDGDDARNNYIGINGGDNLEIAADENNAGSSSSIRFRVDASERMRLDSNGLKFNGDTAAANALDDYEEGSWTPSFNALSTGSVTVNHAKYTKIGRMVFVQGYLTVNSTSGNHFEMSMPFQQVSGNVWAPIMTQVTMNNSDQVALRMTNGSTQAFMRDMADNDDSKTYNNLNGSLVIFAGSYEAA